MMITSRYSPCCWHVPNSICGLWPCRVLREPQLPSLELRISRNRLVGAFSFVSPCLSMRYTVLPGDICLDPWWFHRPKQGKRYIHKVDQPILSRLIKSEHIFINGRAHTDLPRNRLYTPFLHFIFTQKCRFLLPQTRTRKTLHTQSRSAHSLKVDQVRTHFHQRACPHWPPPILVKITSLGKSV